MLFLESKLIMPQWICPNQLPTLEPQDIHVWRWPVPHQKTMSAIARQGLRHLLSHYCQKSADAIEIQIGPHGKPYLPDHSLAFNLSHSGDFIVYAFSRIPRLLLGIDVEKISSARDELAIAKRFFAPAEYEALCALPTDQQSRAFFHIWTQKEAFIKAIGQGLSYPLDSFATNPTGSAMLTKINDPDYKNFEWHSLSWSMEPHYLACLTFNTPIQKSLFFDLILDKNN